MICTFNQFILLTFGMFSYACFLRQSIFLLNKLQENSKTDITQFICGLFTCLAYPSGTNQIYNPSTHNANQVGPLKDKHPIKFLKAIVHGRQAIKQPPSPELRTSPGSRPLPSPWTERKAIGIESYCFSKCAQEHISALSLHTWCTNGIK